MKFVPNNPTSLKKLKAGFSLVEMLIVIALIAIVGTLLIGRIGNLFGGAQEDVAKQFVDNALKAPLLKYRIDTGSYPTNEDGGLMALLNQPSSKQGKWKGPYIEKLPEDPWGNAYQYKYPGTKNTDGYDLWSLGPDAQSEADNIGNW
ncbi:type II secretion system major pseudopilin GspG [Puniceicoccales bacterium CK1056]|uniref:Type II secretion system major pseudopilin GspG n=1 Tax=Oceanipulchritudo coccoides TaxID=2706888 RepID=A0A6B2M0S1_9BACT|nr:type II secretion system major pseudopilin GspG [Oceanipulchritudo coccoides]NDV62508.1 type II secretion system major pseudopilin GspG [Oceanipulchritudo coccoides]